MTDKGDDRNKSDNRESRQWRVCHKDHQVNLILSVHDEIESQSIELQKMLYPAWIKRTDNYFNGKKDSEIPLDVQACMTKAKMVVDGGSRTDSTTGSNNN